MKTCTIKNVIIGDKIDRSEIMALMDRLDVIDELNTLETKVCTKCRIEKKIECFGIKSNQKDGLNNECKECIRARGKELKTNPLLQLEKQVRSSVILENKLLAREGKRLCGQCRNIFKIEEVRSGACFDCNAARNKKWREKNKEKAQENSRNYKANNREKVNKYKSEWEKRKRLKKKLEKISNENLY